MHIKSVESLDGVEALSHFPELSDDFHLVCDATGRVVTACSNFLRLQQRSQESLEKEPLSLGDILKNVPFSLRGSNVMEHLEQERLEAELQGANRSVLIEIRVKAYQNATYLVLLKNIETLRKAQRAKHYFDTFKKQFLTNVSHEFRTPMNGIIGFTNLLDNTILNSIQKEYVTLISRSATTMMNSIENLIELMQIESGEVKLSQRDFNPIEEFEAFSLKFCEVARQKGVQLYFIIDPHIPLTLVGDSEKIEKVLKNLILNAIKFTDKDGTVVVEITYKGDEDSAEVIYSVTDSGEGIAQDKLTSILIPFAAAKGNLERGKDGLGVGLHVAHHLLSMMHSSLQVSSKLHKGSKFSFSVKHDVVEPSKYEYMEGSRVAIWAEDKHTEAQADVLRKYLEYFEVESVMVDGLAHKSLTQVDALFILTNHLSRARLQTLRKSYKNLQVVPVVEPQNEVKFTRLLDVVESIVTLPLLPSSFHETLSVIWKKVPKAFLKKSIVERNFGEHSLVKVLVAEDNPINRKLLQTILMQSKYRVKAVENGQLAVDEYMKEPYDIILMDIDMPVMDGVTATRLIREIDSSYKRHKVPIIALTAHALSGDRERFMKEGLDAHLTKPIEKEALFSTMDKFLQSLERKIENFTQAV